jgi:hypothetical protein
MGGRGPTPKDPTKLRGHRKPPPTLELVADAHPVKPPALGSGYRFEGKQHRWLPGTRSWWKTWRESPQAQMFSATDWRRLQLLAPIVDRYLRTSDPRLMSEIRLGEANLGATPADRARLHWQIVEAPGPPKDPRRRARRDPRGLRVVK